MILLMTAGVMSYITLGHRLARELWGRGDRRRWFRVDQYRDLRRIDSVEALAEFLDHNRCRGVPASENVVEMANAIIVERSAPDRLADPAVWSLLLGAWGLLTLPAALLMRHLWRNEDS